MQESTKKVSIKENANYRKAAISAANDLGFDLSTNPEKLLSHIDEIALQFHKKLKDIKKLKNGEDILNGVAVKNAALIINYIENKYKINGEWYYNHKTFGDYSYPYVISNKTIFPVAWVMKRILNGKSDSVVVKEKELLKDLR